MNLKNKKVLLIGLAKTGISTIKYLNKLGANVVVNDIKDNIESQIEKEYENHPKACLTTTELDDPATGAKISAKSWKDAFKQGLLEGLIVYPISCMLIFFTNLFGGKGYSQVLAIIVATIIIRTLMLLSTFKSQVQQQKLQSIQADMMDISNKLKDPNITQQEKQIEEGINTFTFFSWL